VGAQSNMSDVTRCRKSRPSYLAKFAVTGPDMVYAIAVAAFVSR
jgi:hypothetical protein